MEDEDWKRHRLGAVLALSADRWEMKLHTVFITHNRLELTRRAISSYLDTVTVEYTLEVVDNASTDGTRDWLMDWLDQDHIRNRFNHDYLFLYENRYPGYAANQGWKTYPRDATHLHRADNDHIFLPGWCEAVAEVFENAKVGQVGLRTSEEELHARGNTGGNCVIRRELWDQGLRWDERPWPQLRDELGPGITEDSLMSPAVIAMGYTWTRVRRPCIQPISSEDPLTDPDWPYYKQTFLDRDIHRHLTDAY